MIVVGEAILICMWYYEVSVFFLVILADGGANQLGFLLACFRWPSFLSFIFFNSAVSVCMCMRARTCCVLCVKSHACEVGRHDECKHAWIGLQFCICIFFLNGGDTRHCPVLYRFSVHNAAVL